MSVEEVGDLSATGFEQLCFDIVRELNFHNPKWRTPGSDGGRDIEALRDVIDPTFETTTEKWFIECKKYASSLSWPIVYEKCGHADALNADYLFVMTSSSASTTCLDRISAWNASNKKPKIRLWGKHDIEAHLEVRPHIAAKHGLFLSPRSHVGFEELALEMTKVVSTIYAKHQFGKDLSRPLQYANLLARCWQIRVQQIEMFSRFVAMDEDVDLSNISGAICTNPKRSKIGADEALVVSWILFALELDNVYCNIGDRFLILNVSNEDVRNSVPAQSIKSIHFLSDILMKEDGPGTIKLERNIE